MMKALSICQPWAWLIVNGYKDIENRTWRPRTFEHIAVHASMTLDGHGFEAAEKLGIRIPTNELYLGCIIGAAEVVAVHRVHASPWFTGPFGWELRSPLSLRAIACRGRLGLWELPMHVATCVGAQLHEMAGAR